MNEIKRCDTDVLDTAQLAGLFILPEPPTALSVVDVPCSLSAFLLARKYLRSQQTSTQLLEISNVLDNYRVEPNR
jgi:hypothetical protein